MRIVIVIISILLLEEAVAVYSAYRCLLLVCTMSVSVFTVALAGHSTCTSNSQSFAWWILIVLRIMIITIRLILLKVAVAMYSAYHYFLLVCTTLLFAFTATFAGDSSRMAIFSALRTVVQATSPLPDGKVYSNSNRRRYDNSRGTSISIRHGN